MQYSVISWCSRDNGFLKGLLSLPGKGEKKLLVFVNTKLLTLFKKKLFWDNCRSHAVVRNNIERIYLSPSLPCKQEVDIDMNHQLYWNFTSLHTLISVYVCVWVCVCVCVCVCLVLQQTILSQASIHAITATVKVQGSSITGLTFHCRSQLPPLHLPKPWQPLICFPAL